MLRRKGKYDWTVPGYNYMGPGNVVDNLAGTNAADNAARRHDMAYTHLQEEGINPYLTYSKADDDFIEAMDVQDGIVPFVASSVFRGKRLASQLGLLPSEPKRSRYSQPLLDMPSTAQVNEETKEDGGMEDTPTMEIEAMRMVQNNGYGKGENTKIVPLPRHVAYGLPEVFTTKLKYNNDSFEGLPLTVNSTAADLQIRINSIFDILYTANADVPQWRNQFCTFYDFYTVIGLEWKFTFQCGELGPTDIDILWNTYGSQVPTGGFGGSAEYLLADPRMNVVSDVNTYERSPVVIGGYLSHLDFSKHINEIQQDGNDKVWTATNTYPDLVHFLRIMPRRREALTGPVATSMYRLELTYLVQFRQLKTAYKFAFGGVPNTN